MYIEEIILEGFKSYANRTVISGWDPEFNAITGLNGSGKSNILDAICFVLGIENLRSIRATNLQELVYKKGQAGINKATVTIVFNNEDPKASPVGYQECKQIVIARQVILGGKNTFKINGTTVPQNRLENLFQSVQLNVNNPHFLIMQGRITKVLNMKPPEILAMIEETAGTRMYEDRKEKAESTMEKKEIKVDEITKSLNETIMPKLNKLRDERKAYLEFQVISQEASKYEKQALAHEYYQQEIKANAIRKDCSQKSNSLAELKTLLQEKEGDHEELSRQLDVLRNAKKRSANKSRALLDAEESTKKHSNALVSLQARYELKTQQVKETHDRLQAMESGEGSKLTKTKNGPPKKNTSDVIAKYESAKTLYDSKKQELAKLEELYNGLSTGIAKSGDQVGYAKLIQDEKAALAALSTELHRSKMRMASAEDELKTIAPNVKALESKASQLNVELATEEKALSKLKDALSAMTVDDGDEKQLESRRKQLESQISLLKKDIESLSHSVSFADFQYSHPGGDFNERSVKGLVASLIQIPEKYSEWANALEVCAGGKLYHVVVETEQEASALLERGKLKKRVTIIPLTKIQSHSLTKEKLNRVSQLAQDKANLALHFIVYDNDLAPAMQYVFGSTLLCHDKETAATLAFDKAILTRCITKDGDVYDPAGTMTGGATNRGASSSSLLSTLSRVNQLKQQLSALNRELDQVNASLQTIKVNRRSLNEKQNEVELKSHSISLLKKKLESDPAVKTLARLVELQSEQESQREAIQHIEAKIALSNDQMQRYSRDASDLSHDRSAKLHDIEANIGQLRKELPKLQKSMNELAESKNQLEASEALQKEEQLAKEQELKSLFESLEESKAELTHLDNEIRTVQVEYAKSSNTLEVEKKRLAEADVELNQLEQAYKSLSDEMETMAAAKKKLDYEVSKLKEESAGLDKYLHDVTSKHLWIEHEKHLFNVKGSDYDFGKMSVDALRKKLQETKDYIKRHSGHVNTQVMEMMDSMEKKESHLKAHLGTIKNDKVKIEETIDKLNAYKREALEKTWTIVNKDFGDIFGELLPGSYAQLTPPEGMTIEQGIEIKVRLGNVWKKSLTELSGGQRSLIALALILSLLQFKPAPMYILDEIDAALDLSHTQNIGKLLKYRFKGSQFIIVSLKDGLFNNANVLYRTKFVDGVSTVERTEGTKGAHEDGKKQKSRLAAPPSLPVSRAAIRATRAIPAN